MQSTRDLLREAWQAILRGDYAERDRLLALAKNTLYLQEDPQRFAEQDAIRVPVKPTVIYLPDRSQEKIH